MAAKESKEENLNKNLKLIAKSSMIVFIGLFLSKILTYVYRIIIARYFGVETYGLFSLAVSISSLFTAVVTLGFADGLVRYISLYRGREDKERIKYLIRFSLVVLLFSSIFAGVVLFLFSDFISLTFFHNADLSIFLKIFSFVIPTFAFASIFYSVIRGFEKISWYSFITNIFTNVLKVALIVLLIIFGLTSNAVSFSYVFGIFGMLVLAYLVARYKIPEAFGIYSLKKEEKIETRRTFVYYSLPVMFFTVISFTLSNIDSYMIGFFKGVVDVATALLPVFG